MCALCRVHSHMQRLCKVCLHGSKRSHRLGCEVLRDGEQAWRSSPCPCSYFAVVVYKVLVLLVDEMGGSSAFLTRFSGKPFRINTGPCCCCCLCLPRVPMSRYWHHYSLHAPFYSAWPFTQTVPLFFFFVHRRMFFWLKIGALQYAILKTVLSIIAIVLWTNGNFDLSNVRNASILKKKKKSRSAIWILKHVLYSFSLRSLVEPSGLTHLLESSQLPHSGLSPSSSWMSTSSCAASIWYPSTPCTK